MKSEAKGFMNRHAALMFVEHGYRPAGQYVRGFELETGDVLEESDVYESSAGDWQPCPCPGLVLQAGDLVTWVRPS